MQVAKPGFRIGSSVRVAWAPSGKRLLTVGRRVAVWDVETRKKVGDVKPFSHEAHVDVSPAGDRFVVKNTSGTIAVVDLESVLVRLVVPGDDRGEGCAALFAPGGDLLVDASWGGDLLVRDATTGELVLHERGEFMSAIAASPDRRTWVYVRGETVWLRRWPLDGEGPQSIGRVQGAAQDLAVTDDGDVIVAADGVELLRDGRPYARFETAIGGGTGDRVAWSPDGRRAAHAGARSATVLDETLRPLWHAELEYPSDVAFAPDGSLLAIGDWSKGVVIATPV